MYQGLGQYSVFIWYLRRRIYILLLLLLLLLLLFKGIAIN